jgi:hypothetical protein
MKIELSFKDVNGKELELGSIVTGYEKSFGPLTPTKGRPMFKALIVWNSSDFRLELKMLRFMQPGLSGPETTLLSNRAFLLELVE